MKRGKQVRGAQPRGLKDFIKLIDAFGFEYHNVRYQLTLYNHLTTRRHQAKLKLNSLVYLKLVLSMSSCPMMSTVCFLVVSKYSESAFLFHYERP